MTMDHNFGRRGATIYYTIRNWIFPLRHSLLLLLLLLPRPASTAMVDNGDGTVIDTRTCLQWQKGLMDTNDDGSSDTMDWQSALASAEGLSLAGHSDWRLPDYNELSSIVDYSRNPAFPFPFTPFTYTLNCWSSTTYAYDTNNAWYVSFEQGSIYSSNKSNSNYHVRGVRGGQCGSLGYSVISAMAGAGGSLDAGTPSPQTVANNSDTQFIFNANTGYHIAAVSGCGVSYSNINNLVASYTATTGVISGDCTVSGTFALNQYYSVSASAGVNGSLDSSTPSPQTVGSGSATQFTFNANTGYHVAEASGCGVSYTNTSNTVTTYTATTGIISGDCTVSATFAINQYSVSASAGANGALDAGTPTPQTVNHGSTTQFIFNADAGYHVAGVSGCGINYSNTSSTVASYTATTGAITDDCTVSATFAINQYSVSATAGTNGSLDPSTPSPQTVAHGSTTLFTFNANTGYHVATVTGCGVSYSNTDNTVASYSATTGAITQACTVSAAFAINQYTISSSSFANGSISPLGSVIVNHGDALTFTISPNDNYQVADVLVDGESVGAVTSYTFINVSANHSISASFVINNTHWLSVTTAGQGTGSVTSAPEGISCPDVCGAGYDQGTIVTLTAAPGEKSTFGGWTGDCMGKDATCQVTVDQARSVTARFNSSFPWNLYLPAIINNK
ncbi:MAG: DUF1566 domain-containing protein [Desulfobulbaceae bacterium]|nr:DUF1566 domain-containing protein [Desulfobulbaceae bacterium]